MPNFPDRKPPPDYEKLELMAWSKNADEVSDKLSKNDKNILKKIRQFHLNFGFPEDEIKGKINKDPMFAAHFAVEPRRQNIHEMIAVEWLRGIDGIDSFQKLPNSTKNSLYLTSDGDIRSGSEFRRESPKPGKSLDFKWITGETTFYASHKYTKESGGNQDSQYNEMKELLGKFLRCSEPCALIVIVDGAYYTQSRMNELNKLVRKTDPKSFACPIDGVQDIIPDYLSVSGAHE